MPEFLSMLEVTLMFKDWLSAMRLHYWIKNLLIFTPLIAAQEWSFDRWFQATCVFFCFSWVASGIYLLNDISDILRDRLHPTKSKRAIASGRISTFSAKTAATALIGTGLLVVFLFFQVSVFLSILTYVLLSLLYNKLLKRLWGLDLLALSVFYLLRMQTGAFLAEIKTTFHLQVFLFFLFLGLAAVKRAAEVHALGRHMGRAYSFLDFNKLRIIGVSSAALSLFVFIHYIFSEAAQVLYKNPIFLLGVGLGIMGWWYRIWRTLSSGLWSHDPVEFIWKDKLSWICLLFSIISLLGAVGIYY